MNDISVKCSNVFLTAPWHESCKVTRIKLLPLITRAERFPSQTAEGQAAPQNGERSTLEGRTIRECTETRQVIAAVIVSGVTGERLLTCFPAERKIAAPPHLV